MAKTMPLLAPGVNVSASSSHGREPIARSLVAVRSWRSRDLQLTFGHQWFVFAVSGDIEQVANVDNTKHVIPYRRQHHSFTRDSSKFWFGTCQ